MNLFNLFSYYTNEIVKLEMFPYFEIAKCIHSVVGVREDIKTDVISFARRYPLCCWLSTLLVANSGGLISNALLNKPILASFQNNVLATIIWYVVFYSPYDLGFKIFSFFPCEVVIATMKEVHRCKQIYEGVKEAAMVFPDGYIIMVIIGTIKGNGGAFIKPLARLIRGSYIDPAKMEFMQPSFTTKACTLAAIMFALHRSGFVWLSLPTLHFIILFFFIIYKISALFLGIHHESVPLENVLRRFFFETKSNSRSSTSKMNQKLSEKSYNNLKHE